MKKMGITKWIIISFALIIGISFLAFYPSFKAALYGDDWLAFFRYWTHVDGKTPVLQTHISFFLTPYGPQDTLMGLLRKTYGLQSHFYYFTSFVLRLTAAFSFYPLILLLTKKKSAAVFAVLFFSVTTAGLDTTNWVFNMPTYITIGLFNSCLFFLFKSRETNNFKLLFVSAVIYYFAYITTPIRMHGSLPLILLLELFWILQKRNRTAIKLGLLRFAPFLIVFLIIKFTGSSLGPPNEISERINLGITAITQALGQGRFDLLFYPVVMFGNLFIPDFILPFTNQIIPKSKMLFEIITPGLLLFLLAAWLISKNITVKKNFFKHTLIISIIWTVIYIVINRGNLITFNDGRINFLLLFGGYIMLFTVSLIMENFKKENLSSALFLGLVWSVLSFFFAWWWVPQSIFPTTYRYLIVSAMGATILLSALFSLNKGKLGSSLVVILSILVFIHFFATRTYLDTMANFHSQAATDKIWSTIPYIPELKTTREPYIFYFDGDATNSVALHDIITFGFPPHMAILYGKKEADGGFPVPMSEYKEVLSAVTDGKTMPAYGYKPEPIDINRIYGFRLQGPDNLIDITKQIRQKLTQDTSTVEESTKRQEY